MRISSSLTIIFLGLLLLTCRANFAQEWGLIDPALKYNYTSVSEPDMLRTIFIDSTRVEAGDTVHYLNRVVSIWTDGPLAGDHYKFSHQNASQFMLGRIRITDSTYALESPGAFLFNRQYEKGDEWLFDSLNNITAGFVSDTVMNVLNRPDSVRIIALSTHDTIIWSKKHGVYLFSDGSDEGSYQLKGIEDICGIQTGDYRDYYDFRPGDIYEYELSSGDPGGYSNCLERITILGRNDYDDSIGYEVLKQEVCTDCWYGGDGFISCSEKQVTSKRAIVYTSDPAIPVNAYHGSVVDIERYLMDRESFNLSSMCVEIDEEGHPLKSFGSLCCSDEISIYSLEDTLQGLLLNGLGIDLFAYAEYQPGLGEVYQNTMDFEQSWTRELVAYLKNGIQYGNFAPDEIFLGEVDSNVMAADFKVFPNPADHMVNIGLPGHLPEYGINILDMNGTIRKQADGPGNIEVDDLAPGLYIIQLRSGEQVVQQKLLISR